MVAVKVPENGFLSPIKIFGPHVETGNELVIVETLVSHLQ